MGYIAGYIRNRNGNLAANYKVRAYKRATGDFIGEAITGDEITQYSVGDPYYDYVYLNIDMSGANDSTVFKDLSSNKNTILTYGDTKLKTNTGLFTGSAIYLDGAGDYLTTIAPKIEGDFTVEADIYVTSIGTWAAFFDYRSAANQTDMAVGLNNSSGVKPYLMNAVLNNQLSSDSIKVTTANLNKFAVVRKNGVWDFYSNGLKSTVSYHDNRIINPANINMRLFAHIDPVYWQGYVKFFRITKYARYTESYNVANINYSNGPGSKGGMLGYYNIYTNYNDEIDLIILDEDDQFFMHDGCIRTKIET